jgi:hypothetical protein
LAAVSNVPLLTDKVRVEAVQLGLGSKQSTSYGKFLGTANPPLVQP